MLPALVVAARIVAAPFALVCRASVVFHQQAFVLDPNANAPGAVMSEATTAVVGG